jgi:membrane-associated phospholipid phosphatase
MNQRLLFTISLFILAFTGLSFFALASEISHQGRLVLFDYFLSTSLHDHSNVNATSIFQLISSLGDASTLATVSSLSIIALVTARHWRLVCLWMITLPGAGLLNQCLKNIFQRQRPQWPNPWIAEPGWSFPSGHSMCSLVIYGMLTYSICLLVTNRLVRFSSILFTVSLVMAIGFSRVYLGAHYFSDVMAGYFAAIFWLVLCITGNQAARCHDTLKGLTRSEIGQSAN